MLKLICSRGDIHSTALKARCNTGLTSLASFVLKKTPGNTGVFYRPLEMNRAISRVSGTILVDSSSYYFVFKNLRESQNALDLSCWIVPTSFPSSKTGKIFFSGITIPRSLRSGLSP